MRASLIALACGLLTVSACSKPAAPAGGSPPSTAVGAAPPPAGLTDPQKKAILAALPAAYQSADLDNGQTKFAMCRSCHTLARGGDSGVGPNLWGVFGRKAGSLAGFAYSEGLKTQTFVWDADHLNSWISKPSAMIPGTKMSYIGMESPKDRIDTIAYLATVTSPAPK